MNKYADPEHNDALYGTSGFATTCTQCGQPADYLHRDQDTTAWSDAKPWCLVCRPRRGRRPHHGERWVRAALARGCSVEGCSNPGATAATAAQDPPLAHVRRGLRAADIVEILERATVFCSSHTPVRLLGPQRSAREHIFSDAAAMRAAISDPSAISLGAIVRLLGVRDGGSTQAALVARHSEHSAADPSFPPLPPTRTAAEWGRYARHTEGQSATGA